MREPDQSVAKITCWRMEKAGKGDVIGRVEVPVKTLMDQKQHEQWYPLVGADADQYIAGEMHIKLEYKPKEMMLLVQIVSAKNLAPKGIGGTSNPYIKLHLGKKRKKTKTINKTLEPTFNELYELKLRTDDPKELKLIMWHRDKLYSVFMGKITIPYTELEPYFLYDGWYMMTSNDSDLDEEEYETEENNQDNASDGNTLGSQNPSSTSNTSSSENSKDQKSERSGNTTLSNSNAFQTLRYLKNFNLAEFSDLEEKEIVNQSNQNKDTAPAQTRNESSSKLNSASGNLSLNQQSESGSQSNTNNEQEEKKRKDLGDIRIVLKYTEEIVLPNNEYEELFQLLMEDKLEVIYTLGKVTNEKEDVGRALSRIFEHRGKAVDLIINLTCREVDETENPDVIFRANSLATKAFDYYMKLIGLGYLQNTLAEHVKEIYNTKKLCEVDPTRLEKTDDLQKNFANLQGYVNDFCVAIFESVEECPQLVLF